MRPLAVALFGLLLLTAAWGQRQQIAFKSYAERDSSNTISDGRSPVWAGGAYSELMHAGIARFRRKEYAEALDYFRRAAVTPPTTREHFDFRQARYSLGVTHEALGHREDAIAAYRQALELAPAPVRYEGEDSETKLSALYNLANLYLDTGRHAEAVATFKRVTEVAPKAAQPHYNMGLSYAASGKVEDAVAASERAAKLAEEGGGAEDRKLAAKVRYNLGVAHAAASRYGAAVEAFREAVRLAPDFAEAHYNLGLAHHLLGDRKAALEQQQVLGRLKPEFARELKSVIG